MIRTDEQNKKYYWLKLKRDFFKRHDIRIIEEMPNGKDYILFYLKLLCESVDHEGLLRFSDAIPYSDSMLATITNTNIDIVRNAIKAFCELGMMEILEDGTLFLHEVEKMLGFETKYAEQKRLYREKIKAIGQCQDNVETMSDKSIEIDIESDKEIDIDKESDIKGVAQPEAATRQKRFVKPTLDQVKAYCHERGDKVDPNRFYAYYESNGWAVGRRSMRDWKAAVRYWETDPTRQPAQQQRKGSYFTPGIEPIDAEMTVENTDAMDITEQEEMDLMNMLKGGKS